ncbi:MAG: hypothetical protein FJX72_21145 [Armatimonadetes bacterium]|nr:hypothetical protein [Armatimonadota bacterium]
MEGERKPRAYRDIIDELVAVCREGQGQIGPTRTRAGVWNPHIDASSDPHQHAINQLPARLPLADREIVAQMLAGEFAGGVFETLKALEAHGVPPFQDGYGGSPFHDFVGRLAGNWPWPEDAG